MADTNFFLVTPGFLAQLCAEEIADSRKLTQITVGAETGWVVVYHSSARDEMYLPLTVDNSVRVYKNVATIVKSLRSDNFPQSEITMVVDDILKMDTPQIPFGRVKTPIAGITTASLRQATNSRTKLAFIEGTRTPKQKIPKQVVTASNSLPLPSHPKLTPARREKITALEELFPGAVRFLPDYVPDVPYVRIYNAYIAIDHPIDTILGVKTPSVYGTGENMIQKGKRHFEESGVTIVEYMKKLDVKEATLTTGNGTPNRASEPSSQEAIAPIAPPIKNRSYFDALHSEQSKLLTVGQILHREEKYNVLEELYEQSPELTEDYCTVIINGNEINLLDGYVAQDNDEEDDLC